MERKFKEKIPGGLASGKKPTDFNKDALKAGIKVEMEHTNDPKIAMEIAMDHLTEDPKYYEKLKTIEKSLQLSYGYFYKSRTLGSSDKSPRKKRWSVVGFDNKTGKHFTHSSHDSQAKATDNLKTLKQTGEDRPLHVKEHWDNENPY